MVSIPFIHDLEVPAALLPKIPSPEKPVKADASSVPMAPNPDDDRPVGGTSVAPEGSGKDVIMSYEEDTCPPAVPSDGPERRPESGGPERGHVGYDAL